MATTRLRLAALRAERGLSQRQLAARAGVGPDTVSALERGERASIRFDTLARLCEALECEPCELLELVPDSHRVPVLGGPHEDDLIRERLREPGRRVGPHLRGRAAQEVSRPRRHVKPRVFLDSILTDRPPRGLGVFLPVGRLKPALRVSGVARRLSALAMSGGTISPRALGPGPPGGL